jgi:predicted nucleotidyltransferase
MSDKLNHLPSKSRDTALGFTKSLEAAFGGNLLSVILYGSATGGEFIEGKSDINILVVLQKVGAAELDMVARAAKDFSKKGLAIPLVFDKNHIATSLDTFPIEFSDMNRRHVLLFGVDPLENCRIETKNLRFQCERELKAIIINLRRGYLQSGGRKEYIQSMLESSLSSVIAACRGLVYLNGKTPSDSVDALISEVKSIYSIETAAITRVWHLKKGKSNGKPELMALYDDYSSEIALLAAAVDKL